MGEHETSAQHRRPRRAPSAGQRQRDPERTKERIVEAATAVFSAKGYAGGRVAEIAGRAGVNHQLITYYFGGKAGLYREVGRRWRAHEAQAYPDDLPLPEAVRRRVLDTAAGDFGARLLAWQGLTDADANAADTAGRAAHLRAEIDILRERQRSGELDPTLDPAALLLIAISAASALTVYPQLARDFFDANPHDRDVIEHYADQLAGILDKLCRPTADPASLTD